MKKVLFIFLTAFIYSVFAVNIQEGKDYKQLNSSIVKATGKVEVKEFFSFNCFHCQLLEPLLEKISNKKIQLQRIQIVLDNNDTAKFARISATIDALNLGSRLYQVIFNAIFNDHHNVNDEKVLINVLKKAKLNAKQIKDFMATYNSFTINTIVMQYKNLTTQYNIMGTPTVIVANKYEISPARPERIIEVLNALIDKINNDRKNSTRK